MVCQPQAAALVGLSLSLLASPTFSAESQAPNPTENQRDPLSLYRATGLSADQETRIKALVDRFQTENQERTRQLVDLMLEMRQLSLQPDPDPDATIAKQEQINMINGELALARASLMLKMRQVLTPEQKQKLVQLIEGDAK